MITYSEGLFGFQILSRLHGSAVLRSLTPATLSTGIILLLYYGNGISFEDQDAWKVMDHPYAIGVFMATFTFLLTFRANFSYSRYWDAAGAVHQMQSKWMDVGTELAAFHLQSVRYDQIRPPSFGKHPEINGSTEGHRHRIQEMTAEEMSVLLDAQNALQSFTTQFGAFGMKKEQQPTIEEVNDYIAANFNQPSDSSSSQQQKAILVAKYNKFENIQCPPRLNGGIDSEKPSPFLQEASHLLSLLSAVAMATLRNDVECVETPLAEFIPGLPWPPVDPDAESSAIRKQFDERSRTATVFKFLCGFTRTDKHRTLYNAARPFHVFGGVSDAEVHLLYAARGPSAKVALCAMWLQEFIMRECIAGSVGGVPPPILSRLYQFISDGMLGYNQARKIAYIPFPFPHAQITSLFTMVIIIILPVLMLCYVNDIIFCALLNFLSVMCFMGLHEVALELECPFQNAPNDLPLNMFQAQFNEGLVTMFCGFHPDAWWKIPRKEKSSSVDRDVTNKHSSLGRGSNRL